ncbi:Protein preY, mitochondrial, partial [Stegodyphus mimosarum]
MTKLLLSRRTGLLFSRQFVLYSVNKFSIDSTNGSGSEHSTDKPKTSKLLNEEKLNDSILKLIVCPLTKKSLRYDAERNLLINDELSIGYKIVNGIPNLVPTEAVKLNQP